MALILGLSGLILSPLESWGSWKPKAMACQKIIQQIKGLQGGGGGDASEALNDIYHQLKMQTFNDMDTFFSVAQIYLDSPETFQKDLETDEIIPIPPPKGYKDREYEYEASDHFKNFISVLSLDFSLKSQVMRKNSHFKSSAFPLRKIETCLDFLEDVFGQLNQKLNLEESHKSRGFFWRKFYHEARIKREKIFLATASEKDRLIHQLTKRANLRVLPPELSVDDHREVDYGDKEAKEAREAREANLIQRFNLMRSKGFFGLTAIDCLKTIEQDFMDNPFKLSALTSEQVNQVFDLHEQTIMPMSIFFQEILKYFPPTDSSHLELALRFDQLDPAPLPPHVPQESALTSMDFAQSEMNRHLQALKEKSAVFQQLNIPQEHFRFDQYESCAKSFESIYQALLSQRSFKNPQVRSYFWRNLHKQGRDQEDIEISPVQLTFPSEIPLGEEVNMLPIPLFSPPVLESHEKVEEVKEESGVSVDNKKRITILKRKKKLFHHEESLEEASIERSQVFQQYSLDHRPLIAHLKLVIGNLPKTDFTSGTSDSSGTHGSGHLQRLHQLQQVVKLFRGQCDKKKLQQLLKLSATPSESQSQQARPKFYNRLIKKGKVSTSKKNKMKVALIDNAEIADLLTEEDSTAICFSLAKSFIQEAIQQEDYTNEFPFDELAMDEAINEDLQREKDFLQNLSCLECPLAKDVQAIFELVSDVMKIQSRSEREVNDKEVDQGPDPSPAESYYQSSYLHTLCLYQRFYKGCGLKDKANEVESIIHLWDLGSCQQDATVHTQRERMLLQREIDRSALWSEFLNSLTRAWPQEKIGHLSASEFFYQDKLALILNDQDQLFSSLPHDREELFSLLNLLAEISTFEQQSLEQDKGFNLEIKLLMLRQFLGTTTPLYQQLEQQMASTHTGFQDKLAAAERNPNPDELQQLKRSFYEMNHYIKVLAKLQKAGEAHGFEESFQALETSQSEQRTREATFNSVAILEHLISAKIQESDQSTSQAGIDPKQEELAWLKFKNSQELRAEKVTAAKRELLLRELLLNDQ